MDLEIVYMQIMLDIYCFCNNDHSLSGLKQHIFVILWFSMSEVWHGSHCDKTLVSTQGWIPFRKLQRNLVSPFPALEAAHIPWLMAPFLCLQNQHYLIPPFMVSISDYSKNDSLLLRTHVIRMGPPG